MGQDQDHLYSCVDSKNPVVNFGVYPIEPPFLVINLGHMGYQIVAT